MERQKQNPLIDLMDYAGRGLATADLYSGGMLSTLAGLFPGNSIVNATAARDRALENVPRDLKALATEPINPLVAIFAGPMARTANRKMLQRAEELAAQNAPREQIWSETGWFKGPDQKWRFEIDDSALAVTAGKGRGFERGPIKNTAVAENYDTSNIVTRVDNFDSPSYGEAKRNATMPPWLSGASFVEPGGWFRGPKQVVELQALDSELRKLGAHETQHIVQKLEGFARGGSPSVFSPAELSAERARLTKEYRRSMFGSAKDPAEMTQAEVAERLYARLAGEVEARTVEKRLDYSPEKRRQTPPWMDYDVPESQQIVRYMP